MKVTHEDIMAFLEIECGSLCMDDEDDRGVLASALLARFDIQRDVDDEFFIDDEPVEEDEEDTAEDFN